MKNEMKGGAAPASAVYGLGFIGSLIYFITTATSFWLGAFGVLKAILWPAFLVYEAFKALGA
ncbi:MAG: hypothetical protein JXA77_09075 [Bacteroidales bacterium]|nr:hypothetical protein [Bacteroidales bacterium]MBN2819593.1 hypothetical protein [Bacteroidales bacterium]